VTGQDGAGNASFVADEVVPPTPNQFGGWYADLWGADRLVAVPNDGGRPSYRSFFPPAGGFRALVVRIPPIAEAFSDDEIRARSRAADDTDAGARMGDIARLSDPDDPRMHASTSVDVGIVLDGEVWLELDSGVQTRLERGHVVVQNGTRHAWRNRSDRECLMMFVVVGATSPDEHSRLHARQRGMTPRQGGSTTAAVVTRRRGRARRDDTAPIDGDGMVAVARAARR
jgi:hypothetical protein